MSREIESHLTKRIKIAVAINEHGEWTAYGDGWDCDPEPPAREASKWLAEVSHHRAICQVVLFVEADVPIPTPRTIEGTVASWLDEPERGATP
jgi:hypothetical protein